MKTIFLVFAGLMIFSFRSQALTWNDLNPGEVYQSRYDILGEDFKVEKGQEFKYVGADTDSDYFVQLQFVNLKCADPGATSELILFETIDPHSLIGLKQNKDCLMDIFIEGDQFYLESLF